MSTTTSAQPAQLTRNERLDRLPFNKAHRKLLVASGIGWAFDAMDVGLVSFVVAAIAADGSGIRAEIVAFDDLKACGSMAAAKEKGLVRSEGKDYVMKDGDVTLFRFNV